LNIFKPRWKGFKDKNISSFEPKQWGPGLWRAIHTASVLSDDERIRRLAIILSTCLPCPVCTQHYNDWLQKHPVNPGTDMVKWFADLHNSINIRNKSGSAWSVDQIRASYNDSSAACASLDAVDFMIGDAAKSLLVEILHC